MAEERPAKEVTPEEKQVLLNMKPDDITLEWLQMMFARHYSAEKKRVESSRFETYDILRLKKGEFTNREDVKTNIGLFVFNKFLLEPVGFDQILGYWNETINGKTFGKLEDIMAQHILEDESGSLVSKYYEFLDRLCWISFIFHTEISASKTLKSIKPLPKVQVEKKKALNDNKQAIADKDIVKIVEMQNKLVKIAEDEMKDDPSYQLYASGARGSFDNSYRQMMIMKGPVYNASTGEFDVMTNSLYEGVEKKDIPVMANAIVEGVYPKSIGTGECGYQTKKLASTFQGNVLGPKGSDCKSTLLCDVELTGDNVKLYRYQFIKVGKDYERLDSKTESKYVGKTVKMRLPTCCVGKQLCNRCAGDRMYLLGVDNVGLTTGRVSNSLLRARMKKAHDATVRMHSLSLEQVCV